MYQNLIFEIKENIAHITLNRPEVFNSLNRALCKELLSAFQECKNNEEVKVIILCGAGKGFCAGQDLAEVAQLKDLKPSEIVKEVYNPLILEMRNLTKPIICRLNGVAAGAGCSLVLACDMVIASSDAVLTEAFVQIGLVPDSGSSFFLPQLVGRMKAFELFALGSKVSSEVALQLGLVNKVVPPEALEQTAFEIASQLKSSASVSVGLIKSMLNKAYYATLENMLETEAQFQDIAANTEDFKEGINAFKEKRKPNFKGK